MEETTDSGLGSSRSCLELWIESDDIYGFAEALDYIGMYLEQSPHKQFFWENDRNKVFGRITDKSLPLEDVIKKFGFNIRED